MVAMMVIFVSQAEIASLSDDQLFEPISKHNKANKIIFKCRICHFPHCEKHKDGLWIWVHSRGKAQFDKNENPIRMNT